MYLHDNYLTFIVYSDSNKRCSNFDILLQKYNLML